MAFDLTTIEGLLATTPIRPTFDETLNPLPLKKIRVFRTGSDQVGGVETVGGSPKDGVYVLFYNGTDQADVDAVARLVGEKLKGAVAILLLKKPSTTPTLPVFVLDNHSIAVQMRPDPKNAKISIQVGSLMEVDKSGCTGSATDKEEKSEWNAEDRQKDTGSCATQKPEQDVATNMEDGKTSYSSPQVKNLIENNGKKKASETAAATRSQGRSIDTMDVDTTHRGNDDKEMVRSPVGDKNHPLSDSSDNMETDTKKAAAPAVSYRDAASVDRRPKEAKDGMDSLAGATAIDRPATSASDNQEWTTVTRSKGRMAANVGRDAEQQHQAVNGHRESGYQPHSSRDLRQQVGHRSDSETQIVFEENPKQAKQSLLGMMASQVSKQVSKILGSESWSDVLGDMKGWHTDGSFRRYRDSMKALKACDGNGSRQEIVDGVYKYLKRGSKVTPFHMAFAAKVFQESNYGELGTLILEKMHKMPKHSARILFQYHSRFSEQDKPHIVFLGFLKLVVNAWEHMGPFSVKSDKLLVCILAYWNEFGLFRRDDTDWKQIQRIASVAFFKREQYNLATTISKSRVRTLGFFLCRNIDDAFNMLIEIAEAEEEVVLEPDFVNWFKEQSSTVVLVSSADSGVVGGVWGTLFAMLEMVIFGYSKYENRRYHNCRREVISALVRQASFRERGSFRFYDILLEAVSHDHRDYQLFLENFRNCLYDDLTNENPSPSMDDFLSLLNSKTNDLLKTPKAESVIFTSARSLVLKQHSLERKLRFVESLHGILLAGKTHGKGLERQVSDLVVFTVEGATKPALWNEAFRIAKMMPALFTSIGQDFADFVAREFFSDTDGACFIEQPALLVRLLSPNEACDTGLFYERLRSRVEFILCRAATSIKVASSFCLQVSTEKGLETLAQHVFQQSYSAWNPNTVRAILAEGPDTLHLLFQCLQAFSLSCDTLSSVVVQWCDSFQADGVTKDFLQDGLQHCQERSWEVVRTGLGIELPTATQITEKLTEMEQLRLQIVTALSGPEGRSLSNILRGYNCHLTVNSILGQLLTRYDELLPSEDSNAAFGSSSIVDELHLAQIRDDCKVATQFRSEHDQLISVCDYFLTMKSALFRKGMAARTKTKLDVGGLQKAMQQTLQDITVLFGSEATFRLIDSACKTVSACGISLENELEILMGCEMLQLNKVDLDRFQAAAMMSRFAEPLHQFMCFCQQFNFAVVESDPSFSELQRISVALRSGEVLGFDAYRSVEFSNQLVALLYPGSKNQSHELHSQVSQRLPGLKLLGELSSHSEIWSFLREKDWFGEEGLKRFYEEYNNVTNVLLGNSASFEMSVLDSLEPTVRAVSYIGSLHEEKSVGKLLDALENSTVRICSERGNLLQVQSHISQISDWFGSDGVDDVSAVFSVFDAVHSGEYSLQMGQDGKPTLTLNYRIETEKVDKSLQGQELVRFVQHVSLIQHEDDRVARRVSRFLEQHQVVSNAAENILGMVRLGFSANTESFVCSVGGEYIDEATELLLASEAAAKDHDGQLQHLRKLYPECCLFSSEELRWLFELAASGPASESWPDVAHMTYRLLESAVEPMSFEERLQACATVAVGMQEDLQRCTGGWLRLACKFIENLRDCFGEKARQAGGTAPTSTKITLHTMAVDDSNVNGAILDLMRLIYKDRLPEGFEVLDVQQDGCTLELLDVFLQRAQAFTANIFVILNVDRLSGALLEHLLNFLSKRQVSLSGVHLHCIQRHASNLHTGPWVDGNTWDLDSLGLELDRAAVAADSWRGQLLNHVSLDAAKIVWTPKSGTGKTHFIQTQLGDISANTLGAEVASVTIHEKSSLASLIADLTSKFSLSDGKRACHFNFCYFPDRRQKTSSWLESINQFFFSLIVLRAAHDPSSGRSFYLGERNWELLIELPGGGASDLDWLRENIPVLAYCGARHAPPTDFVIDPEVRRVCTYLRAHSDRTIDRQFAPGRQILFVLDWSLSMHLPLPDGNTPLAIATDNALRLFDSHVSVGDMFSLSMFDDTTDVVIPLQEVHDDATKARLRAQLDQVRQGGGGGTDMFESLCQSLPVRDTNTWLVCLTDGYSTDSSDFSRTQLRHRLMNSSDTLRIILIGVNLKPEYEEQMRYLCGKYSGSDSGCFIRSGCSLQALNESFDAVSRRIPVSETFELYDGVLSDDESRFFLRDYTKDFVADDDLLMQMFWVRFLYRRVKVFDMNTDFNENVKYDKLGSTLMEVMLEEARRLLAQKQSRDWIGENHAQLIYDFVEPSNPQFRLVCTAPESLSPDLRARYESLDLPGFRVPTNQELNDRVTLHRFLSQALGVPLETCEGGARLLKCVEEHGFILTLDFAMKLLNIHERAQCRVPCLVEGETGVSKTALTKMYAILRNSSLKLEAEASTVQDIQAVEQELESQGFARGSGETALCRLLDMLETAAKSIIGDETEVAGALFKLLQEKQLVRASIFRSTSAEFSLDDDLQSNTSNARAFLSWFAKAELEQVFFEINVDASLSEHDVVDKFWEVRAAARKMLGSGALVVVFLDEINTSSVMGLLKEIVVDKSLMGELLEDNIVIVAACNPCRTQATTKGEFLLENDLGREWASGHYQVVELPPSLTAIKWAFGSLTADQEKEFVFRRLERIGGLRMSSSLRRAMTEVVSASQEAIRCFATKNIYAGLLRVRGDLSEVSASEYLRAEAVERAASVVSLRDIQRTFHLYEFFLTEFKLSESVAQRDAMILAVAVVYYLRLDDESREQFKDLINELPTERRSTRSLQDILDEAMEIVIDATEIPRGIALTRGLKENTFMTLVCLLSRTPLLIVGPPGTSKTLAVNMTADNAQGEDSPSKFYRGFARLSMYHYQCSKESTSKEIAAVFDKAIQRQDKLDSSKHLSFVFMDEAGHPEEEKESLKVLHYLLEGHMSTMALTGFVAISNHCLDAAKSNRCAVLLRQDPDEMEMMSITRGVLFDSKGTSTSAVDFVQLDSDHYDAGEFAQRLQASYAEMVGQFSKWACRACKAGNSIEKSTCGACGIERSNVVGKTGDQSSPPSLDSYCGTSSRIGSGENFFGLRDYIYFLKALRNLSIFEMLSMSASSESIVFAVERNFNGVNPETLRDIALIFLHHLTGKPRAMLIKNLIQSLRDPLDVIRESLSVEERSRDHFTRGRYKLLIDKTEDDSIMRLLGSVGVVDLSQKSLFKLSQLQEDVHVERQRLISSVKYAALQGQMAVLSQTEPVNEALYDLLNQRYRVVAGKLYANVATGGQSRRCLVRPNFEVLVHIRSSELAKIPAPFLNRFEKYSLDTGDVLKAGWKRLGRFAAVPRQARARAMKLIRAVREKNGMFGWVDEQTLDSVFIDLLPTGALTLLAGDNKPDMMSDSFAGSVTELLGCVTSLRMKAEEITPEIDLAKSCLPQDLSAVLLDLANNRREQGLEGTQSMLTTGTSQEKTTEVYSILVQMIITRVAVNRLMQIATPEAVYLSTKELPSEVVSNYFSQEHFSLRRLITKTARASDGGKLIVYTRSDAVIDSLPNHSAVQGAPPLDAEQLAKLKAIVHENTDDLIVEHLSTLRSEQRLRTSVESWIKQKRRIYVLVIDMGLSNAVEHANFSRTFIEQRIALVKGGIFVLLLHYPPSVANRASCYPALFLQGWEHVFLDGVGNAGPELGVEACIEQACISRHRGEQMVCEGDFAGDLSKSLKSMLPRVIGHVATRRIESQSVAGGLLSYDAPYQWLTKVMRTSVGGETVGDILCGKFAKLWLEKSLPRTMKRASDGLLKGTTQLSLSMSVRTNLMDSFDAYVSVAVNEMNQRQSLAILSNRASDEKAANLFGEILRGLPVAPFEELVLMRKTLDTDTRTGQACRFPFFDFISSWLDDLVDFAIGEKVSSIDMDASISIPASDVAAACGFHLDPATWGQVDVTTAQRRDMLGRTIRFVEEESDRESTLFDLYLQDFLFSKTANCCASSDFLLEWIRRKLEDAGCSHSILYVHCFARIHERDFMSVASWGADEFLLSSGVSPGHSASGGHVVVERLLCHFEYALTTGVSRREWRSKFERFLRQICSLCGCEVADRGFTCRIRVLCFFSILLRCGVPEAVESRALDLWYDDENRKLKDSISTDVALVSLSALGSVFVGDGSTKAVMIALQFFFSSLWINITPTFRNDDFNFLVEQVSATRPNNAASLLLGGCLSYGTLSQVDQSPITGVPVFPLQLICCQLGSNYVPSFSCSETRSSLPHYIPDWLRGQMTEVEGACILAGDDLSTFFEAYGHSFEGPLAEATWNMILRATARDTESMSSEQQLLVLLRDVEIERSIVREEYTRLARTRSQPRGPSGGNPLAGSLLSAMILDARLVCFVAKVAFELATQREATALAGTYGDDCNSLLEQLMMRDDCLWNFFFFHTIIRVRGEGTMANLLDKDGPLHGFAWCRQWVDGGPVFRAGSQADLEAAERELTNAVQEEERKSREFLLCPNCRNPFIVDQRNCGQFRCGQDAHGGIAGAEVRGGYGCGQEFNVAHAQPYVVDQHVLRPFHERVEQIRACVQRCDEGASLWERARSMEVPVLDFVIEKATNDKPIVPTAVLATQPRDGPQNLQTFSLLQRVRNGSDVAFQIDLLPDLIEFYAWVHSTFRYLPTRKQASEIRMRDIMDEGRLGARFDADHTAHVLRLWQRISEGLQDFLARDDCRVLWECEEIAIPFTNIDDAPLIRLLSEGEHPTDGNDYLFLIINSIINRYGTFVRTLAEFETEADASARDNLLHPKFVVRGSYGAVACKADLLPDSELDLLVQSSWDSESHMYDWHKIEEALRQQLVLHVRRPLLMNPMENLRERFIFREETEEPTGAGESHSIALGRHGIYFANTQDFQLYNDVSQLLEGFELIVGSDQIRRTLEDSFHSLGYDELRSLLGGVRGLLQLMRSEGKEGLGLLAESVKAALRLPADRLESERSLVLEQLGFPNLSNSQYQELLSLQPCEMVELVRFVGSQLASEAYIFSGFQLCLKEPLGAEALTALQGSINLMKDTEGLETTLAKIDELVRDVLSFYERLICREALSNSQSLRGFFLKNNALDKTDPVFSLIPSELTLRNYVSLRCHLHQLKLSLMYHDRDNDNENLMETDEAENVKANHGRCWLWDDGDVANQDVDDDATVHSSTDPTELLWFARGVEQRDADEMSTDENPAEASMLHGATQSEENGQPDCVDPVERLVLDGNTRSREDHTEHAARMIQRWWRRVASRELESQIMMENYAMEDFLRDDLSVSPSEGGDLEQTSEESPSKRARLADSDETDDVFADAVMEEAVDEETPSREREEADDGEVPTREIDASPGGANNRSSAELESCSVWTSEALYSPAAAAAAAAAGSNTATAESKSTLYGNADDETCMRRWLDEHNLPQSVGDLMVDIGARKIEDVVMVVKEQECEEELAVLKKLDRIKLKKAVRAFAQASTETNG